MLKFTGSTIPTNATYSITYGDEGTKEILSFSPPEMVLTNLYNVSYIPSFRIRIHNKATDETFMEKVDVNIDFSSLKYVS